MEIWFMSLETCHLLFVYVNVDLKNLLEDVLRFQTDVISQFHLRGWTSVTQISFKYKLMGFRINVFKMIPLTVILCLFIHNSRSKHSCKTTASNLH